MSATAMPLSAAEAPFGSLAAHPLAKEGGGVLAGFVASGWDVCVCVIRLPQKAKEVLTSLLKNLVGFDCILMSQSFRGLPLVSVSREAKRTETCSPTCLRSCGTPVHASAVSQYKNYVLKQTIPAGNLPSKG